jgi:hypothetical protein
VAVPEVSFTVCDAAPLEHAAVPTLRFALEVASPHDVRSIVLDVQLQIAARRRAYDDTVHDRLFELFGPPDAWGTTLRTLPWTRMTVVVPPFEGRTVVDLHVPCSYDLEVVASRYFDALEDGAVPLEFLFAGTIFHGAPLQAARISWESEAEYALPVRVWKATMERHFRDTAWLRVRKDRFDRLVSYKSRRALASWEDVVDELLERA